MEFLDHAGGDVRVLPRDVDGFLRVRGRAIRR
jgi:hypothetical protein